MASRLTGEQQAKFQQTRERVNGNGKHVGTFIEPVPLFEPDPDPMPREIFRGWLGDHIAALADATETPFELSALMGIAATSIAIRGRFSVRPEPGYFESLAVYCACSLPSGSRKTAVTKATFAPHIAWERCKAAEMQDEIKRAVSMRKSRESQIKRLREQLAKAADTDEYNQLQGQILEAESEVPEIPVIPQLFTSDVTPEHLATMLGTHGERMAIVSDEGGIIDTLAGLRYSDRANIDLLLQAYSGSPVRVNRGSRPAVSLDHPLLQIAVTPQPVIASEMVMKPGFGPRGLLARFTYAIPRSNLGERTLEPRHVPEGITRAYADGIETLLDTPAANRDGRTVPHTLSFSDDAYKLWKQYQREIEKQMQPGGMFVNLTDLAAKLPGQLARIAGILHVADFASAAADNLTVSGETMQRAMAFMQCAEEHAIRVFGMMATDNDLIIARRLWEEIEKLGKMSFSAREAWLPTRSTYPKIKQVEPGFTILIERGWIIEADDEAKPGRPSRQFTVNPRARGFAHASQGGKGAKNRGKGGFVYE